MRADDPRRQYPALGFAVFTLGVAIGMALLMRVVS